jgi:hypothetical protein
LLNLMCVMKIIFFNTIIMQIIFQLWQLKLNLHKGFNFLNQYFKSELKPILGAKKQSGWITIRFTVNCNGEKGRYKLYQMDETYKNFSFNTQLIKQIFDAFMKLPNQWTIKNIHNMNVDAGYHLVFKIKNGKLVEVF